MKQRWQTVLMVTAVALAPLLVNSAAGSDDLRPHLSVVLGATRSNLAHEGGYKSEAQMNGSAGLLLSWPRTRASSLEAGAIVEGRGGSWFSSFAPDGTYLPDEGFERRLDLAYLILPIRIRAGMPALRITPSVHAGVEFGYRLYDHETTFYRRGGARYSPTGRRSSRLRDGELAVSLGGRLSTNRLFRTPFVELTYAAGIGSVNGSAFSVEGSLPRISNRGYRLLLGFCP